MKLDRPDVEPSQAVCVEAHDLVLAKLVAGREKDFEFAAALMRAGRVDIDTLVERAALLPVPGAVTGRAAED